MQKAKMLIVNNYGGKELSETLASFTFVTNGRGAIYSVREEV